jgi:hypothetical protein
VEQPQNFDLMLALFWFDPKQYEVSPFVAASGHMQGKQSPPYVAHLLCADCHWPSTECH